MVDTSGANELSPKGVWVQLRWFRHMVSCFEHVPLEGDHRAVPGYAGKITSLSWFENASVLLEEVAVKRKAFASLLELLPS